MVRIMRLPRGLHTGVAVTLSEDDAVAAAALYGEVPELIATAPSWADTDALANYRGPACVSLFLPTTPVSTKSDESRLQFKNLAREALNAMPALGVTSRTIAHIEAELAGLVGDARFWANQRQGLAIFASDGTLEARLLNYEPSLSMNVSDRFVITPLVADLTTGGDALVLALSQNVARLLTVAHDGSVAALEIDGMPADVIEAAGQRSDVDRSMTALDGREGQKVRMGIYAHAVDAAIGHHLAGSNGATPLILAAAQPLDGLFRAESHYPHLHPTAIAGSPDNISDAELGRRARAILLDDHRAHLERLQEEYHANAARRLASNDIDTVARAATAGAVRILLVNSHVRIAGTIDDQDGAITWSPECNVDCYDVVDEIVRRTHLNGGEIFVGEPDDVPDQAPVAAMFRYEI